MANTKKSLKHREVVLHPHHAKPYRKRHVSLLGLTILGLVILLSVLLNYRDHVMVGVANSKDYVSSLFQQSDTKLTVQSDYGFSVQFDTNIMYADAVDGSNGKVYDGSHLKTTRKYTSLQFSPLFTAGVTDRSAVLISYHPELKSLDDSGLENLALADSGVKDGSTKQIGRDTVTFGGKAFTHTILKVVGTNDTTFTALEPSISLYTANISGHPMTIVVHEGFVSKPGTHHQYDALLESLRFGKAVAVSGDGVLAYATPAPSLIDLFMHTQLAAAKAKAAPDVSTSSKIAALYSPAVNVVYNIYCLNATFDVDGAIRSTNGHPVCGGGSGSGFFVSSDGYFATNGHVANYDPIDMLFMSALDYMSLGDSSLFNALVDTIGTNKFAELQVQYANDADGLARAIIDEMYKGAPDKIKTSDLTQSIMVLTGNERPDLKDILATVQKGEKVEGTDSLLVAEPKAIDFRAGELMSGYMKASDVAILKVSGKNFPVVHLGSFDDVNSGSNISILGFPGVANDNGLVDKDDASVTLTAGSVSNKKKSSGSNKMLLETDTTIGHGNSGGPVFDDEGYVVGLATYGVGGNGDAAINYVRDIKDLKTLAKNNSITFNTTSKTQTEWEQGMDYFYTAHYSKALPYFNEVKKLYPNHNKVAEFIASAKHHIANGDDVKDFPVIPVAIAAGVLVLVAVGTVVVIVRQKGKHNIYQAGVSQGVVQPMTKGADPQTVHLSPANINQVLPGAPSVPATPESIPVPSGSPLVGTAPSAPASPQPNQQTSGGSLQDSVAINSPQDPNNSQTNNQ